MSVTRTITREERVAEFNRSGGNRTYDEGGLVAPQVICFSEELVEFNEALADYIANPNEDTRAAMIKEWADVQVTLSNFAWFFDFNGQVAFTRVANSNMSKLTDGKLERRDDGKILKGPNYEPPNMKGL